MYIGKVLQEKNFAVKIIDYLSEEYNKEKFIEEVKKVQIVGITVLSFNLETTNELIKIIKETKPKLKVIIGGPHCSLFPKRALEETKADICVQGDGEIIINDIIEAINGKLNLSEIHGIYYKENNKILSGKPLELITNLDTVSFPARSLVKDNIYGKEYDPHIKAGEFTTAITSRGCPFNCKFCSRNYIGMKKYRSRSIKNILEELKILQKQGYKIVAFEDDSFLADKKHAIQLFQGIIDEKIKMKFIATAVRVDSADEKLFNLMKKAGVTHLQFGLESGNQEILDFYNKKTDLKKIRNAILLSNKMGFFTIGTFILGAPIETEKHFKKTINFAKSLSLDSVSFLPLKYIAGSELWCKAVQEGKISEYEYIIYANSKRNLGLYTYEELISICNKAHRKFYMRLSFILKLLIKSLRNDDFGFLQSYITLFFSNIFGSFHFLGFFKKTTSYDS